MKRPIAISLAPNLEGRDILLALKLLFSPLSWFSGDSIKMLEQWFRHYFKVSHAISFNSGRGCLYAILKVLDINKDDEVLLQAFTCVAVPNAVIANGARPIYVDISESLNMNVDDLKRKISQKTKAIIVQHTFGIPAEIDKISRISQKYHIPIIEDCAHTTGGLYKGKRLGTFGVAGFFSFGRDKAFSSVFGGMAITNDPLLGNKLRHFQQQLGYPSFFWIIQQLFHPIAFFFILPVYNVFSLGKLLLVVLQKLNILSFPVLEDEKKGKNLPIFVKKLPNALACLALDQLRRVNVFNQKRQMIAGLYAQELSSQFSIPHKNGAPPLRFSLLIERRQELIDSLKKEGIYIGKWYSEVIDPKGVDLEKIFYHRGSCPKAEYIAKKIVNLPTYPTMLVSDAKKILRIVKKYA